jgi:hypothetical protein
MEEAFMDPKEHFTISAIWTYYSTEQQCLVETDIDNFALRAVISENSTDDKLYPIDYH